MVKISLLFNSWLTASC